MFLQNMNIMTFIFFAVRSIIYRYLRMNKDKILIMIMTHFYLFLACCSTKRYSRYSASYWSSTIFNGTSSFWFSTASINRTIWYSTTISIWLFFKRKIVYISVINNLYLISEDFSLTSFYFNICMSFVFDYCKNFEKKFFDFTIFFSWCVSDFIDAKKYIDWYRKITIHES
jgi:hypothetical protein